MALPADRPDLRGMYEFRRTRASVRDPVPPYAAGPAAERFPADDVLTDLESAAGPDGPRRAARILARYAALRHWLLRAGGAPAGLIEHAEEAARAHVACSARAAGDAVDLEWAEGELLLALLEAAPARGPGLLREAAAEAERDGCGAGAAALTAAAREGGRTRAPGDTSGRGSEP